MGALASSLADVTIVTADNPRSESLATIIQDIEKDMHGDKHRVIEDRREAIRFAISTKQQDDILLIAGKGHEEYQTIGSTVVPFDDAEVVRECFVSS
jgi:UDP-N-acetylmuramoyl-L-alanyl-D-glutamate--2,6-diaminopimelate ligase